MKLTEKQAQSMRQQLKGIPDIRKARGKRHSVVTVFSRNELQTATRGVEQDQKEGYIKAYRQWNRETDKTAREQKR